MVLLQNKINKKGFTLVEALIVIAIIGVLMLILAPSIITITNKNKEKACESTRKSIISAAKMYVAENKYDIINCGNNNVITIDVTINDLKSYGNILEKDLDSRFPSSVTVNYDCTTKEFDYEYNVNCQS